jgi:siderophore synthetase component
MTMDAATIAPVDRLECGRLINTWLREKHPGLAASLAEKMQGTLEGLWEMPVGDQSVIAVCNRYSPSGFHAWDDGVLLRSSTGSTRRIGPAELAGIILEYIDEGTLETRRLAGERIAQSIQSSRGHAAIQSGHGPVSSGERAERSLWFGHPFHPLAKSIDGFSLTDIDTYSPERGASFRLCWLLAAPDEVVSFVSAPDLMQRADALLAEASGLDAATIAGRVVMPCHPWQAERLQLHPDLRGRLTGGALSLLGPSGPPVTPTSSVRTVRLAQLGLYIKLPLEAQITNFSRVNTAEQLARSIGAAHAIAAAQREVQASGLTILTEPYGRTLRKPPGDERSGTCPETGFLLRFADFPEGVEPIVVAGLVEPDPRTGRPNLSAIAGPALDDPQRVRDWVQTYTGVVLLPLVHLFATTGICLEAHTQNSLVAFEKGRPSRLFVRDLEGVAVDRECFSRVHPEIIGDLDDALLYDRDIAWRRFLYYVVVNHFAHVLSAVAELSGVGEARLWAASRHIMEEEAGPARALVEDLLSAPFLPAKANLSSCIADRGENPRYVMIPNPFKPGCPPISRSITGTAEIRIEEVSS